MPAQAGENGAARVSPMDQRGRQSGRPFALKGKLLRCFCEVRFPVFSSWLSTWTVLSSVLSCSEVYRRFTGGFFRERGFVGDFFRKMGFFQKTQNSFSAKCFWKMFFLWGVGEFSLF